MEYEESSVKSHSNVKVQGVVLPGGLSSSSFVAEAFTLLDPTGIGQVDTSSTYMESVNLALRLLHQRYNDVENKQFNNECIQQINLFYGLDLDAADFIGAMTHLFQNNHDGATAWLLFGKCPIPKGRYDAHGTTMSDGVESASESAKQSPSLIVLAPIIQAFDKLGLLHSEANSKDVCTLQANGSNCKDPSADQGIKRAHVINFVGAAFQAGGGGLHFCGMGGKSAMKNVADKLCSRLFESCYNANHFSLGACMTGGILGDAVAHTREMSLDYKTLFEGAGVPEVFEALVKDPNVIFIQNVNLTEEEIATLREAVFKRRSEKSKRLHEKKVKNKHGVEVSAHAVAMCTALHEEKVKNKHGVEVSAHAVAMGTALHEKKVKNKHGVEVSAHASKLHEKKVKNKHGVEVSAHAVAMCTALHEKKVKNKHGVEVSAHALAKVTAQHKKKVKNKRGEDVSEVAKRGGDALAANSRKRALTNSKGTEALIEFICCVNNSPVLVPVTQAYGKIGERRRLSCPHCSATQHMKWRDPNAAANKTLSKRFHNAS